MTDYVYDLLGNLRQERLPGGVVSDYTYDPLNRLDLLRQFKDGLNSQYENVYESGVDTLLAEYDYDLAADGRRTGVTEKTLVDLALEETRIDWLYDALGRLTREVYDRPGMADDRVRSRTVIKAEILPEISCFRAAAGQLSIAHLRGRLIRRR